MKKNIRNNDQLELHEIKNESAIEKYMQAVVDEKNII